MPTVEKALCRAGLSLGNMDLTELKEAFAAQAIACLKSWNIANDDPRHNVNGSGISLGHPVGATGVRILADLLRETGCNDPACWPDALPRGACVEHDVMRNQQDSRLLERMPKEPGCDCAGLGNTLSCKGSARPVKRMPLISVDPDTSGEAP